MPESFDSLLDQGDRALQHDDTLFALMQYETAHAIEARPAIKAKLAYCLARERKEFQRAMALCRDALVAEPDNPDHYFQLGRISLLAGRKQTAIKSWRKGLKIKRYQPIIDELNRLGLRKPPIFAALPREHFLNRSTGKLLHKLGNR
jgi:tetratricopeptide (TPR) repeat protein